MRALTQIIPVALAFVASAAFADAWPEVYDPFRVRTLYLQMESGSSWGAVVSDNDFDNPQDAQFWTEDETPIAVTVKRKSDPAVGNKVSVKIDMNARVAGQRWHELEKLSLENGAEGGLVKEGLAWQMHRLASDAGIYNYPAAYAAWVRLVVDGQLIGVYTSVEERDDRMLKNRGMWKDKATWLYKNDPNPELEEGSGNSPTFTHFCFSPFRSACAGPADFEADLTAWIDMQGMLTLGAIEAFTANGDGLFTHDGKNHFFADFNPPLVLKRLYFPWDMDTGISDVNEPLFGSGGAYQTLILGHPWFRQWFLHIMSDLIEGPLSEQSLTAFLNALEPVLTPALIEDPNPTLEGDPAGHFDSLRRWVTNRIANVRTQIGTVLQRPIVSVGTGQVTISHSNALGTIYYTLDGSDPRASGGAVAGTAYSGPLPLNGNLAILARVRAGSNWSALSTAFFHPSNHAAAVKLTEIMYQPMPPGVTDDAGQFEFLELQNRSAQSVNLSGCFFEGVDFRFKAGTVLAPNSFLVFVRNGVAFASRYPGVAYHGIYGGGLDQDGEKIRLKSPNGNTILSAEYNDAPAWPLGANGFGLSLVNRNPEGDPDDYRNWRASRDIHGSPGAVDPVPSYGVGVMINEVLAHTDPPLEDAIELHNPTDDAIDIGGWWLSDQIENTNPDLLRKFLIPPGTTIPAGGYRVFYEHEFNTDINAFALSSLGDQVYLASAGEVGDLTGYIVGMDFGASDNGVPFGALQTSETLDVVPLTALTLGAPNALPRIGPVIINEIMYHPGSNGTEFLELYNITATNVNLEDWVLRGANYTFTSASISAGGFLLVVGTTNMTATEFRSRYGVPASVPILTHKFDLQNSGELLELSKPNDSPTNAPILVDRVRYNDKGRWPLLADGLGPSLEKIAPRLFGNEPFHWRSSRSGGSPGRANNGVTLLNVRRDLGAFAFEFATEPGASYTVEFSPVIEAPDWRTLINFIATTQTAQIRDNQLGAQKRFYRVMAP
jgi:hypothetical protein